MKNIDNCLVEPFMARFNKLADAHQINGMTLSEYIEYKHKEEAYNTTIAIRGVDYKCVSIDWPEYGVLLSVGETCIIEAWQGNVRVVGFLKIESIDNESINNIPDIDTPYTIENDVLTNTRIIRVFKIYKKSLHTKPYNLINQ